MITAETNLPSLCTSRAPRPGASAPRPAAVHAVELRVAAAFAIPVAEMQASTRRSAAVAFARQSAMYLARIMLGLNLTEIGHVFGRDRTTVAHACRVVEERRDEPGVEALLSRLEQDCAMLGQPLASRRPW